jgi:hypothetical protein
MEVVEPYVLQFSDGNTITLSNTLYNSFGCFSARRHYNNQHNVLDFSTFTLPRYKEISEEYYPTTELLSYVWMNRLLKPFKKRESEKVMACLKKYDFNELCIMLHDYNYLGLQEERLKIVMGAIVSSYIEQYKNDIVVRVLKEGKYGILPIVLKTLLQEIQEKTFVCQGQENCVALGSNEYIMKFFINLKDAIDVKDDIDSTEVRCKGTMGELPVILSLKKKKIIENCLDFTAFFDEVFELKEMYILALIDFEGKKKKIALCAVKKIILDRHPTLDSLPIEKLCASFPNLETVSAKDSQLTEVVLSEEEKLCIMGIKGLKPLILKQPLTLWFGKNSHPVTLDQYKKMGSYA